MLTNLSAEETTDNLLDNSSFTTDTSSWELSDTNQNKVKRDPNTYSDSSSKSVRFRYQGGSISQDVDISNVPDNHIVKEVHMGYQSIGCGNTGNQWCTAGADDTVVSTITLSSTDSVEAISNTHAIPYEDGWSDYSFSEEVLGTFNTDDLNVNLNIIGNDTGNSSQWYGPIIDNISLTFTIEEYIEPIVETIIEPEITIGGLDLSTEVTLDLIQEVQIELPEISMDIPEVEPIDTIEMPDVPIAMDITPEPIPDIQVEMPVDIPEIEPIQEIAEIEPTQQPEVAEEKNERREIKQETESKTETAKAGESNAESDIREPESDSKEKGKGETKESTADNSKSKSKTKDNVQANRPTDTDKKDNRRPKATLEVNTAKPKTIEQPPLPIAYLQILQDSITIVETITLEQEQIYGGEQEYNLNTSSITIAGLDNNSSSRWDNLQNERKRFKAPKYSRRSKKD